MITAHAVCCTPRLEAWLSTGWAPDGLHLGDSQRGGGVTLLGVKPNQWTLTSELLGLEQGGPNGSLRSCLCRQVSSSSLPGWGCWGETAEGCGWDTEELGSGRSGMFFQDFTFFPGSLCFSHRHRQQEGKCTLVSEDGTMWQRDFAVPPSQWCGLGIAPVVRGRKTEGFIK